MGIKDKRKDLRPREKLQHRGPQSLSDYELLMAIIGSGNAQSDVTQIARNTHRLFKEKGSELTYDELLTIAGLGPAKANQIMAGFEFWRRQFEVSERVVIDSDDKVVGLLSEIRNKKQEYFVCISLDGANRLISNRTITIGTLTATLIHPREVFADAISDRAASIIVAHNHPSGSLHASDADISITKTLVEAGKILGITVKDHVIVTANSYKSLL